MMADGVALQGFRGEARRRDRAQIALVHRQVEQESVSQANESQFYCVEWWLGRWSLAAGRWLLVTSL